MLRSFFSRRGCSCLAAPAPVDDDHLLLDQRGQDLAFVDQEVDFTGANVREGNAGIADTASAIPARPACSTKACASDASRKRKQVDCLKLTPEKPMSSLVDELAEKARALPAEDRARLAEELLATLHGSTDPEVEAAWDEAIRQRLDEIERGTATLVPAADVIAEVRRAIR
ncbi:MAG TPA: addiction module protein [Candidatus Limnocylindrales bacterium]|nr:addiction module protein [Candidatus Limnocylindrales bacterium]